MKSLSKEELKKKKKFHQKKAKEYAKKISEFELKEKRIGFKWYD